MATGTASSSANTELSTVTANRSRIPNARLAASEVLNCVLVKKFAWSARSDGTARINKKTAINTIAMTIVEPAAIATALKSRSPSRPVPALMALGGTLSPSSSGMPGIFPWSAACGTPGEEPSSGRKATTDTDQAMLLIAVDNLGKNSAGTGMYPLSAKPACPGPMVACRNAFTAGPVCPSEYFEHTISYVANTIGEAPGCVGL